MRKTLTIALLLAVFVLSISIFVLPGKNICLPGAKAQIPQSNSRDNSGESNEQIYYDLFVTMLYPYVEQAIENYYSEYMSYIPGEAPCFYKFVGIEKTSELNYSYTIELEVQPYVGPHLSVGRDRITFIIDLGEVKVKKFEHIESYKLPPWYQDIFKEKLPNASTNTQRGT